MIDGKEVTPAELAKKTGLHERYVRELLSGQAAPATSITTPKTCLSLSPEQVMAFAEERSPAFFAGAFDVAQAIYLDEPKVAEAFSQRQGRRLARAIRSAFSPGRSASSGPATTPIWSRAGFRPSKASKPS